MQFLWRYIDELVGKGLEAKTIAQFLMYTAATLVPMALPLSVLMSSLMTFGNLGEKYELTAMKASGISLQRIMAPMIIIVVFICFGAFFFANNVLPYANLQMRSLLYDIRQQKPEVQLKPGEFISMIDGYSIRIQDKNTKTGMLYNVQIYDHTGGKGNSSLILADSGYIKKTADNKDIILTLFNGHSYNELQDKEINEKKRSFPHRYDQFQEQQIVIKLGNVGLQRTDQSLFKSHYAMMNLEQLTQMEDSLKREINQRQNQVYKSLITGILFKKRTVKSARTESAAEKFIPDTAQHGLLNLSKNRRNLALKNRIIQPEIATGKVNSEINPAKVNPIKTAENNTTQIETRKTVTEDTKLSTTSAKNIDIDSLFNVLTLKDKNRLIGSALSYARSAKNVIENSLQSLEFKISYLRRYEIEWHRKFTIAVACLVFLFLGAPLGAIIRKGGLGLPLVLSVIFFIFYYILSLIGDKLVRESIMPAYQGMWFTSGIFLVAGVFLTYQAATDSSILNLDTYMNFLKRIFGQRYNVVDKLSILEENISENKARIDNIISSLSNLDEALDERIAAVSENLQITEFLGSLYALQSDSNLILFERYYNQTFSIIINHPAFHKKNIRAKIYEFPSFNYKDFQDENGRLVIRVILACTIVLTPIVALRHFFQLLLLRAKLKKIKQLLPELLVMFKMYETELKAHGNSSNLQ
jgi:lipopolysaccharide export system permease protein